MLTKTLKTLTAFLFLLLVSSCTLHIQKLIDENNNNNSGGPLPLQFQFNVDQSDVGTASYYYFDAVDIDPVISDQFATAAKFSEKIDGKLNISDGTNLAFLVFSDDTYSSAIIYVYIAASGLVRTYIADLLVDVDGVISSKASGLRAMLLFGEDKAYCTFTAINRDDGLYVAQSAATPFIFNKVTEYMKIYPTAIAQAKEVFNTKDNVHYAKNTNRAIKPYEASFTAANYTPLYILFCSQAQCPFETYSDIAMIIFEEKTVKSTRLTYLDFGTDPPIVINDYPTLGTNSTFGAKVSDSSILVDWNWLR